MQYYEVISIWYIALRDRLVGRANQLDSSMLSRSVFNLEPSVLFRSSIQRSKTDFTGFLHGENLSLALLNTQNSLSIGALFSVYNRNSYL